MADDILLTPEEQDEKARQWLKENGLSLAIGITLGLGAIFGYNQYKAKLQTDAETASALYSQVLQQVTDSEIIDIEASVTTLKTDFPKSVYAAKAALINAEKLSKTDMTAALSEYKWVGQNAKELGVQHTARIREAKLLLATGDVDGAIEAASKQPYDNFASHYYEILGDAALKQDKRREAFDFYQQATEQLLSSDAAYASVLGLKMAPLPKPEEDTSQDTSQISSQISSQSNDNSEQ